MKALLRAEHLQVYLASRVVLKDLNLELQAGAITAVLGENGSGKSTLARAISGLIKPQSGLIFIGTDRLETLSATQRAQHLACTLQEAPIAFDFKVCEVVDMAASPGTPKQIAERRTAQALQSLQLTDLAKRPWTHISGGERQRAHIARLLASTAKLLILDEPSNHLDLASRVALRAALKAKACEGAAVLFTTHDLEEACWADWILVLHKGTSVFEGPPQEVLTPSRIQQTFGVCVRPLPDPLGGTPAFRLVQASPLARSSHERQSI